MEQNRDPQNKSLSIWSNDLQQVCQDHSMGKEQNIHMYKSEVGPLPYTIDIN